MLHARIAARAFNTPLLVEPSKAMAFLSGLGPRILGRRVEWRTGTTRRMGAPPPCPPAPAFWRWPCESYRQHGDAPYPVVDGIAVIEIAGVLIHRGGWIGQSSGQTSYEGIAAQIEAAASDPAVRGLALEIDSFGGEVAGVFDLADRIRAIRASKAGLGLRGRTRLLGGLCAGLPGRPHPAAAHRRAGQHRGRGAACRSQRPARSGRGARHADPFRPHKVDGNPYQPLPEGVRDDIQREIDVLRFLFAETVAAGRAGRLSQEAALATEAATFRGADAVAAGLADEVTDLARGFAAFRQMLARRPTLSPARAPARIPSPPQTGGTHGHRERPRRQPAGHRDRMCNGHRGC
jgi:capsid assembly protease